MQLAELQQNLMMQMQQQMSDQFQQTMGFVVEAFMSMQREQTQVVKRELRRIRALTRELTSLQEQLVKSKVQTAAITSPTAAPSDLVSLPISIASSAFLQLTDGQLARSIEPASILERERPVQSEPAPALESTSTPKHTETGFVQNEPIPASPPLSAAKEPIDAAETTSKRPAGQSPADMHAWLNERVATIQRRRQSSWQRLLNAIQGKSATGVPEPKT